MKNNKIFIYTLSTQEEPNNIRYIGKTNDPKNRIERHLQPYYLNENTYKSKWLKSEIKKGYTPILNIIDVVEEDNWQFWEIYWIEQFKAWNFNLTNGTIGGDGIILNKNTINKRNNTRIENTYLKNKEEFDFYKIKKIKSMWSGEIICNCCKNIIKYKKNKRCYLLKEIRRFYKENRICEQCDLQRKKKKLIQLNSNNEKINTFESIRFACIETGVDRSSISRCCKGIQKTAGGFFWKFV